MAKDTDKNYNDQSNLSNESAYPLPFFRGLPQHSDDQSSDSSELSTLNPVMYSCTIPCHKWPSEDSRENCEKYCTPSNSPEASILEKDETDINQEFIAF